MKILALVFATLTTTSVAVADRLVVWNVGQGSWATVMTPRSCFHFDMGGEFVPWSQIRSRCSQSQNGVLFSHWDSDHVSFLREALRHLPNLCALARPLGEAPTPSKDRDMRLIPDCVVTERTPSLRELFKLASKRKSSNGKSRVFEMNGVLFPGDSGSKEERAWEKFSSDNKILIAGHHGSNTATSASLLRELKSLRLVIVSARKEKYGHPGAKFSARLRARKLPVLTTELWGSVYVEL